MGRSKKSNLERKLEPRFRLFCKLPKELQYMIWEFAVLLDPPKGLPRYIHLITTMPMAHKKVSLSPLLRVCRDSRAAAKKQENNEKMCFMMQGMPQQIPMHPTDIFLVTRLPPTVSRARCQVLHDIYIRHGLLVPQKVSPILTKPNGQQFEAVFSVPRGKLMHVSEFDVETAFKVVIPMLKSGMLFEMFPVLDGCAPIHVLQARPWTVERCLQANHPNWRDLNAKIRPFLDPPPPLPPKKDIWLLFPITKMPFQVAISPRPQTPPIPAWQCQPWTIY